MYARTAASTSQMGRRLHDRVLWSGPGILKVTITTITCYSETNSAVQRPGVTACSDGMLASIKNHGQSFTTLSKWWLSTLIIHSTYVQYLCTIIHGYGSTVVGTGVASTCAMDSLQRIRRKTRSLRFSQSGSSASPFHTEKRGVPFVRLARQKSSLW